MTDGSEKPDAGALGSRLDALKRERASRQGAGPSQGAAPEAPKSGMQGVGYALRIGTEMVASLLVGLAIGYGLDHWLGTAPWLMILFLFFGMAAGVSNVYRLASGMDMGVGWRRPGDRGWTSDGTSDCQSQDEKGDDEKGDKGEN